MVGGNDDWRATLYGCVCVCALDFVHWHMWCWLLLALHSINERTNPENYGNIVLARGVYSMWNTLTIYFFENFVLQRNKQINILEMGKVSHVDDSNDCQWFLTRGILEKFQHIITWIWSLGILSQSVYTGAKICEFLKGPNMIFSWELHLSLCIYNFLMYGLLRLIYKGNYCMFLLGCNTASATYIMKNKLCPMVLLFVEFWWKTHVNGHFCFLFDKR